MGNNNTNATRNTGPQGHVTRRRNKAIKAGLLLAGTCKCCGETIEPGHETTAWHLANLGD